MTQSMRRRGAALLAAAAVLAPATCALAADPTPTPAAITRDGSHDFDFDFGVWRTEITRRLHPLSASTETMKLSGTVTIRKVWGGNRTRRGADTQAILMSVLRTLKLRGINGIDWMRQKMTHQNPPILA